MERERGKFPCKPEVFSAPCADSDPSPTDLSATDSSSPALDSTSGDSEGSVYVVPKRRFGQALWNMAMEELTARGSVISVRHLSRLTGISTATLRKWRDDSATGAKFFINDTRLERFCRPFDWEPEAVRRLWRRESTSIVRFNEAKAAAAARAGAKLAALKALANWQERECAIGAAAADVYHLNATDARGLTRRLREQRQPRR
jgi:hypothetical protein